jgi:hypothetical protein
MPTVSDETVVEVAPSTQMTEMQREVNRGLMVGWINRDLMKRFGCDVLRSQVFYDADGVFAYALPAGERLDAEQLRQTRARTSIRYFSKGV